MSSPQDVRIDKWLWCVRLFKSRSLATAACVAGHVRIGGEPVKPSRSVRIGEIVTLPTGHINRTVKVVGPLEQRVGAKLVPNYMEDLTPASEYLKPRESAAAGAGRPTKKQRRQMEHFWNPAT
jgi:ribosome-associated heat shock protein Hsp15